MNQATIDELVDLLTAYNRAYRQGAPMVDDAAYDDLVERLRAIAPDHPFLQAVEPEQLTGRREVRHPAPMLSIEKAYHRGTIGTLRGPCAKRGGRPWSGIGGIPG